MEGYLTSKEIAEYWHISQRRIQIMCAQGMIEGVQKHGKMRVIPKDANRPVDGRLTTGEYRNWRKKVNKERGETKDGN